MHSMPRLVCLSLLLVLQQACTSDRRTSADAGTVGGRDSAASPVDEGQLASEDTILRSAALRVVTFLQGAAPYETLSLADTVELLIAEEGGGTRRRVQRAALRDREAWVIHVDGRRFVFAPPAAFTEMSLAPGRHLNCVPGPLAARAPTLAAAPHVGVRLVPPGAESCLQGWNATFVFDTAAADARLTAVVYDQWEW